MGRPTKFDRSEAIEVAMHTFWEKGFAPTSVSDLASAMSITRSSFYNSFRSREAIFDEALARYRTDDVELDICNSEDDFCPSTCLRDFFRHVCAKLGADPENRGCLIINCFVQASPDAPAPAAVVAFMETKRQQFGLLARLAQQGGKVNKDLHPEAIADGLLALLIGINVMGKTSTDTESLWHATDTMLSCLGFED